MRKAKGGENGVRGEGREVGRGREMRREVKEVESRRGRGEERRGEWVWGWGRGEEKKKVESWREVGK